MSADDRTRPQSSFFFPLRTNAQFLTSEMGYLGLTARVKQSLLLYDKVLFQAGVYWTAIGSKGRFSMIRPFEPELDSQVRYTDENTAPGFVVSFKAANAPPEAPFTDLVSIDKLAEYQSQFHTLVDEIRSHGIADVSIAEIDLTNEGERVAKEALKSGAQAHSNGFPSDARFMRDTIAENLNMDLLLISQIGVPASVDGIHAPLLAKLVSTFGELRPVSGFGLMETAIPYVGDLPWEEIAELRKHPGLQEFRLRMVSLEEDVRQALQDANDDEFRQALHIRFERELIGELSALRPQGRGLAANVALQVAGALLPPLAPVLSAADVLKDARDLRQCNRSWIAVLMKLLPPQGCA